MKFKLDENLPVELAEELNDLGHDTDTVRDERLSGADDPSVLQHAGIARRILLTMDKGIADVRQYPPERYHGIVLIRPPSSGRLAMRAFIRDHLPSLLQLNLIGTLTILSSNGIRQR